MAPAGETVGDRHPTGLVGVSVVTEYTRWPNDRPVALILFLFAVSAFAIYLASEYFVNGVEWVGRRMGLAETATGTVLAAIGTALPESMVTFMAVAFGHNAAQQNVGIGAAFGGPLVLACIAYPLVGIELFALHRRLGRGADARVHCDAAHLARDQLTFLLIFLAKVGLGVVAFSIKPWLGWLFLAAYGVYIFFEVRRRDETPSDTDLAPLKLSPHHDPALWLALTQTLLAMAVIAGASRVFVVQLEGLGVLLGLPAQLVAVLLSPIATELPEVFNAIIWVRQGREHLALANLSGAMMAQATVPAGIGILYTPWLLSPDLVVAGIVTALATLWLYLQFDRQSPKALRLAPVVVCYAVFGLAALYL
ncbi:MAG TPA: hypothetical protein VFQ88_15670 [Nevskiaceae bacterium]|nr:hypothetical protein [Nevskiaceae bacterium]